MKRMFLVCIIISTLYCIPTYAKDTESKCGGKERWDIKVLNDSDAKSFILSPELNADGTYKFTTVHELINMKLTPLKRGHDVARQDFEKKVVAVKVIVQKYKHETDADLHIVIEDPSTHETMIAESPDPSCPAAIHSGHAEMYTKVRKQIASYTVKTKKGWSTLKPGTYEIIGVLFQDFIHGQTGVAPNGIELHPILGIKNIN